MHTAAANVTISDLFWRGLPQNGERRPLRAAYISRELEASAENRHHAEEVGRAAATAVVTTAAAAPGDAGFVVGAAVARGNAAGEDFGLQRLVLHGVQIPGPRIAAGGL